MKLVIKTLFLFLFLVVSSQSWANIIQLSATATMLDASNVNTNQSGNPNPNLLNNDAYAMRFDLSSIPGGQKIVYAHLYRYDSSRGYQQSLIYYRLVRNFVASQATWNIASTGTNWGTAGALNSSTDYTTTNSASTVAGNGEWEVTDISGIAQDALTAGSVLNIVLRAPGNNASFNVNGPTSGNPPYLILDTVPTGQQNTWYVRDGGGNFGTDSSHCNGTANVAFTGANGPNCAINNPRIVTDGDGFNPALMVGGDTLDIDGDSDNTYAFTVSGVATRPVVGDEYTNNGITYTVTVTLPGGKTSGQIAMSGSGAPQASGNLTVVGGHGSGTSPIAFSAEGTAQAQYGLSATMNIPGGVGLGTETVVQATGNHYAQLYPTSSIGNLVNGFLSYQNVLNLDLTVHDSCIKNGPIGPGGQTINPDGYLYVCGGGSVVGNTGFLWGGTDLNLTNVLIHGFENGMNNNINGDQPGGTIGNITLTNVKVFGNNLQGAIMGNSQSVDNVMTGTMYLLYSMVEFSGCGARYPMQDTADIFNNIQTQGFSKSIDNESNYYNCWGQDQDGYGDGYGFGANAAPAGNWTIIGSSTSFNTQDGVDTLHGLGNGLAIFSRSRSEGNGGQQIKINGATVHVENSIVISDCARWWGASESSSTYSAICPSGTPGCAGQMSPICRAGGDNIVLPMASGTKIYIENNTIDSESISIEPGPGSTCDSTTLMDIHNNLVTGGGSAYYDGVLITGSPTGNEQLASYIYWDGYSGDGGGPCEPVSAGGQVIFNEDYNVVYNTKNSNNSCGLNGAHDVCGTVPGLVSTYIAGTVSINNGSPTVTGVGTTWTSSMVGEVVAFGTTDYASASVLYPILSVNSPTSITLGVNYSGSNLSGSSYVISLALGTPDGPASYFYHGTQMYLQNNLASGSVARGAGNTGLSYANGSNDYNNYRQTTPKPDSGGLQYGSTPQYPGSNKVTYKGVTISGITGT